GAGAMPATAHTGSDTTPVKSRAVADSPTRSSMSHYSANSMAQGGGGGHPRRLRGAGLRRERLGRLTRSARLIAHAPLRFAHARSRAQRPFPILLNAFRLGTLEDRKSVV